MNRPDIPTALRVRRAAVIGAAGLSGLLVLVSMFVDPAPDVSGPEMVAGYAADLTASGLHTNLIHYGFALVAPVVFAVVALVRDRGAWLANIAGVMAILGLTTLPGLVLLDFSSVATLLASDIETVTAMEQEMEGMGWFLAVVIPAFFASMIALPLALVAAWRAGLVPGWLPLLTVVTPLAIQLLPTWWVGFGVNAVTSLAVALCLARIPLSTWYGSAVPITTTSSRETVPA
jgi:hypothetical protein